MLQDSVGPSSREDRYAGIRALWLKVIIRAIFDWVSYRDSTKFQQKKLAEQAYNWLFNPSILFNGFDHICAILEIPPEKVRLKARSMSKEQVAKIEHLEREGFQVAPRLLSDGFEDC